VSAVHLQATCIMAQSRILIRVHMYMNWEDDNRVKRGEQLEATSTSTATKPETGTIGFQNRGAGLFGHHDDGSSPEGETEEPEDTRTGFTCHSVF
jgi:hypothetical protein